MKYKTVIISDLHLGSTYSRTKNILKFLDEIKCETLILNGDIIDGWAIKRGNPWTKEHMKCLVKIMKKSYDTKVIWVRGNHDDFLNDFIPLSFGNISIVEDYELESLNGKRYLVLHGDIFDVFTNNMKWLAKLGSIGYDLILWLNKWYNKYQAYRGKEYYSLSKTIKDSVKSVTSFIGEFENHMVTHSKALNYDGVICGHIHKAEIRIIKDIEYMNSGDWVESNTALVEDMLGNWSIIQS
jgi:UDP-2,3-diacylglucosamine pyrophosphatase LpxH